MDTPKRFGPTALGATAATFATIGSTETYVVKSVIVCNETTSSIKFTISVGTDAAGKRIFKDVLVNANDSFVADNLYVPLGNSEVIQASATVAASLTLTVGGVSTT